MRFALKRGPESLSVTINGREVPVAVRRNPRAKRLILRVDPRTGAALVTLPTRISLREASLFVGRHAAWLEQRLDGAEAEAAFADGTGFPLRGKSCHVVHRPGRGLVRHVPGAEADMLEVPGGAEHVHRRVADWLKRQARADIEAAVAFYAEKLGRAPSAIRIGDARSRWGSCTGKGALTLSWRLILAPPQVLSYVAAHEVAHLAEMNHSPRFWAVVQRLDPGYEASRTWLKVNGGALHAIGRRAAPEA